MKTRYRVMSLLSAAAVAVCTGAVGTTAIAATNEQPSVDIEGSRTGAVTVHSRAGIPGQVAQLSQRVSYRDLDLGTRKGADELADRIQQAATSVCDRLGALYPAGSFVMQWEEQNLCVSSAVHGAMKQAKVAIVSAEREHQVR